MPWFRRHRPPPDLELPRGATVEDVVRLTGTRATSPGRSRLESAPARTSSVRPNRRLTLHAPAPVASPARVARHVARRTRHRSGWPLRFRPPVAPPRRRPRSVRGARSRGGYIGAGVHVRRRRVDPHGSPPPFEQGVPHGAALQRARRRERRDVPRVPRQVRQRRGGGALFRDAFRRCKNADHARRSRRIKKK